MRLAEFLDVLNEYAASTMQWQLPDGTFVPAHFHVTEVGRVQKDFIDCGGTVRSTAACVLQVWVAEDRQHRLSPWKLGHIMQLAAPLLTSPDLPVEVEFENGVLAQYPIDAVEATPLGIIFKLGRKHADCLAPDRCGVTATANSCCTTPGCC